MKCVFFLEEMNTMISGAQLWSDVKLIVSQIIEPFTDRNDQEFQTILDKTCVSVFELLLSNVAGWNNVKPFARRDEIIIAISKAPNLDHCINVRNIKWSDEQFDKWFYQHREKVFV